MLIKLNITHTTSSAAMNNAFICLEAGLEGLARNWYTIYLYRLIHERGAVGEVFVSEVENY